MPSTTSSVVSIVFDSSTVMTPSLPTFFMASAMADRHSRIFSQTFSPNCITPFVSRR
jgi:hypothetical protein